MIDPKNYVLVYKTEGGDSLLDVGDDPCFENPPSWGICRPDIRNRRNVTKGSRLLFVAQKEKQYYLRGYFEVEEKITVIEAFNRFPNRQNVIIQNTKPALPLDKDTPIWLSEIVVNDIVFYHKETDNHDISNWKCRRIFNCKKKTLIKCTEENRCRKNNNIFYLKRNYVVGNISADWQRFKVRLEDIISITKNPIIFQLANGRHREVEITSEDLTKIIEHVQELTRCDLNTNSYS